MSFDPAMMHDSHTAAPASSSSSAAPPSIQQFQSDDIAMDEQDEQGEFVGDDEAVEVIPADENDAAANAAEMEDDTAMQPVDEEPLTEEEQKQRAADDAKTAAMATGLRAMLDADDSKQGFFDHQDSVFCVVLSKTTPNLVLTGDGDNQAYLWDTETGNKRLHLTGHTDSVIDGGFSHNGALVATASMDATVRVYHVADGSLKHSLEGPAKELEWMQWHPNGPIIIAGSLDETVWMWNAESGECMSVFSGHSGGVTCGSWTRDGKQFISVDESGGLIVWNPKSGTPELHLKQLHDGAITSLALHPDKTHKFVMTGGHDGEVKIINYETGKILHYFKQLHTDSVEGVEFASHHKLAASCSVDGKLKILDLTNGDIRVTCQHEDAITHIQFAPKGEPFIYSSSVDKTVRLWDIRSGQCMQTWKGHSAAVLTFSLTEDGGTIVTGADDHTSLVFKR